MHAFTRRTLRHSWIALILGTAVSMSSLSADQSCNSKYPEPPGTLAPGASGTGLGASRGDASEAAFRALTGYSEPCAKCGEETEERCPGEGAVAMGPDGVAECHPIPVPVGFPPIWSCTFVVGADGGAWQYECFDC